MDFSTSLQVRYYLLLSSPYNRWGNWGKWKLSRFFKITKLEIISCNLTAEPILLKHFILGKKTTKQESVFFLYKCSRNIYSRLKLVKSILFFVMYAGWLCDPQTHRMWETMLFQGQPVNFLIYLSWLLSLSINESHNRSHSHFTSAYLISGVSQ